ncbi:ATP synthase subunit epsilon [Nymphaea thermarum]|nr:ATP synthase subunit epsilon [Nymphaea thermarum]
MASAGASAAVPFWRAAGMTYITYSNICASLLRGCLKEPYRSEVLSREKVHFSVSKWVEGKPEKPATESSIQIGELNPETDSVYGGPNEIMGDSTPNTSNRLL